MNDDPSPTLDLPVWAVELAAEADRTWFPRSLCVASADGQRVVPLFTDADLAARYIEDSDGEPRRTRRIGTWAELDVVLHYAYARGVRRVALDVPDERRPHERGWHFSLADLIRRCCGPF